MNLQAKSQAERVSDDTFTARMWRLEESGNSAAAKEVRLQWRYAQTSAGYRDDVGALTRHEIEAFARDSGGDAYAFARAVERAALIKAMTLLPELRQSVDYQKHSLTYGRGITYGFAAYSGAIRALAMGPAQDEAEENKAVEPRRRDDVAKLEQAIDTGTVRPGFEAWAGPRQFDLRQQSGEYTNMVTAYAWMGWLGASLDKEGSNGQG
ncbi:hypothetical protein QPK32_07270 [Massilia sp. YIM B02763]|uniref:hypothetical protein n=1 Tax=Massilia sp. YIM B02763 TaxID=3050130 RepID=UPI0025B68AF3|nr:hypothetical protein [Massilia sp. YIM B02763]MDN4052872.1 hypothetical protein [Massilia sp. YIM B02763]